MMKWFLLAMAIVAFAGFTVSNSFAQEATPAADSATETAGEDGETHEESGGNFFHVVVLLGFLWHGVASLDAVESLASRGAVFGAHMPARSLLEACLYVHWVLQEDTERRAAAYYVGTLRKERSSGLAMVPGTPESDRTKRADDQLGMKVDEDLLVDIERDLAEMDSQLTSGRFGEINEEFDRCRTNRKGKRLPHDPHWYQLFGGPRSIRALAEELELDYLYHYLYGYFCSKVHVEAFQQQVQVQGNTVASKHMREARDVPLLLNATLPVAWAIYRRILAQYRPNECENLARKYVTEWRERFTNCPRVRFNQGDMNVI